MSAAVAGDVVQPAAGPPADPIRQYRLIRPEDQLELIISAQRTSARPGDGRELRLVADQVDPDTGVPLNGRLTMTLAPQAVIEWANPTQPRHIFGANSIVAFRMPFGTSIPLTVRGVLAALSELELAATGLEPAAAPPAPTPNAAPAAVIAATVAERQRVKGRSRQALVDVALSDRANRAAARIPALQPVATEAGAIDAGEGDNSQTEPTPPGPGPIPVPGPPLPVQTGLQFPSRLVLTVRPGATRFAHAATPVEHNGAFELWHTRLSVRRADGRLIETPADIQVKDTREIDSSITDQGWLDRVSDKKINSSLNKDTRQLLVQQTRTKPAVADRLMMSGLGAWLDIEGEWPSGLTSWRHQMEMGRDVFVRTAQTGVLYPLGHNALRVDVTERVFDQSNGRAARLQHRTTIVVRQRERTYTGVNDNIERSWPWQRVRLLTRTTPAGTVETFATAAGGANAVMAMVGPAGQRRPFEFRCLAVDRGGRVSTFDLPLVFVPDSFGDLKPVETEYAKPTRQDLRTIELRGQTLSVASTEGREPDSADVITESVRLTTVSAIAPGAAAARPLLDQIVGRVPAFDRFTKTAGAQALTLKYAGAYLASAFDTGNVGEALLALVNEPGKAGPLLDLGNSAITGGLIAPRYELTGLSRRMGPVGGDLAAVATGTFTARDLLGTFADQVKLLGVFALRDLLGDQLARDIESAPKLLATTLEGLSSPSLGWHTVLFEGIQPGAGIRAELAGTTASGVLRRRRDTNTNSDLESTLDLTVDTSIDGPTGTMRQHSRCTISNVEMALSLANEEIVILPLASITFDSKDGEKPDVDVNIGPVQFKGILAFVAKLASLIPLDGFHDPPALDIRPDGVTSSFSLPAPPIGIGVFCLENLVVHSQLELFFAGAAPTFELGFGRLESPFRVTVSGLGGGGYVAVKVSTDGLRFLAGSLEFGAALTVNLGVARGSVSAMGGLAFFIDGDGHAQLTAYFTIRGELRVLGLISISIEQTLALGYSSPPPKLTGRAELVVCVKVWLFKKTVKIAFERTFVGSDAQPGPNASIAGSDPAPLAPPTFADLMAVGEPGERGWDTYCLAFAKG